jgi:DAK2 domain fusion protein YloV
MAIALAPAVDAARAALAARVGRLNALNVYPVPDGDTGTNMLLTLESVSKAASEGAFDKPAEATKAVARAALMGARGNSGVILSQIIRGACDVLADGQDTTVTSASFVAAIEGARDRAYSSVREPVEGTMLTVIKDAARAAREHADEDFPSVVHAASLEAHASVRRTPDLLEVLRSAGVVDAGGLGVALILDGLYAWAAGEEVERFDDGAGDAPDLDAMHAGEEAWGYCTEFIVTGFGGDPGEFEDRVHASGRSVLVVPDDDVVKVHLHTQDPGEILSYAGSLGRLSGVKIDDMEAQVRARSETPDDMPKPPRPADRVGVVAASRGEGSRRLFESMGAVVIDGGQGANPSAADFAAAVEETGAQAVILLPNNKNVIPTVEQVGEIVYAKVYVVPTISIAGGLVAMVGFDAEGDPDEIADEMQEIVAGLRCAEVTQAVREARIGDRKVPEGSFIGLLDGELVAVEKGAEDAAIRLIERMLEEGPDMVTLLRGYGMDEVAAERVAGAIRRLDEDVEVEIKDGGQPLYPLQMVAE